MIKRLVNTKLAFLAMALVAVMALGACGEDEPTGPIKIGVGLGLTGAVAYIHVPWLEGAQLAVDEVNAAGGVNGRLIELSALDNKGATEDGLSVTRELIHDQQVDFLMSGWMSNICMASTPEAEDAQIIYMAGCMTDAFTTSGGHDYSFRATGNALMQGYVGAEYMAARFPDKKTFYVITANYEFGASIRKFFLEHLKELVPDAEIVGEAQPAFIESDFGPIISDIQAKDPDVVVYALAVAPPFLQQAIALGMFQDRIVFSVSGHIDQDLINYTEEDGAPVGMHGAVTRSYAINDPAAEAFDAKIQEKYERVAISSHYYGYNSARALIEGIEEAGSTDTDKVREALEGLVIEGSPFGPVTIRACDHQVILPMWVGEAVWDSTNSEPRVTNLVEFNAADFYPSCDEVAAMREAS
jgi:branched-chain amino acid transport system substrate-binding protein